MALSTVALLACFSPVFSKFVFKFRDFHEEMGDPDMKNYTVKFTLGPAGELKNYVGDQDKVDKGVVEWKQTKAEVNPPRGEKVYLCWFKLSFIEPNYYRKFRLYTTREQLSDKFGWQDSAADVKCPDSMGPVKIEVLDDKENVMVLDEEGLTFYSKYAIVKNEDKLADTTTKESDLESDSNSHSQLDKSLVELQDSLSALRVMIMA